MIAGMLILGDIAGSYDLSVILSTSEADSGFTTGICPR